MNNTFFENINLKHQVTIYGKQITFKMFSKSAFYNVCKYNTTEVTLHKETTICQVAHHLEIV